MVHNWRVSEASETLSGVCNRDFAIFIYLFIYIARKTSFFACASNYILVKGF